MIYGFIRTKKDWRESLLLASVPWSLFLTFVTEALSQLHLLTRTGVAVSWVLFTIGCLAWVMYPKRPADVSPEDNAKAGTALSPAERIGLASILLLLGLVGLTAIVSAPNSGDAMQYHLPRVVQWVNNRSVEFFPTNERQQLDMPPFTEYAMLHAYLLYGSDRLVALVQWLAYAGFVVAASCISKELGGDRRTQIVAAVLSATIPSAILGASGTKNECVLAYWIACAVYLMLRWKRCQDWTDAFAIGASLGLAAFTKGTAYLFLPCMVFACWFAWGPVTRRRFLIRVPVMMAVAVLVCAPLWIRNYEFCGSILGLPYFEGVGDPSARTFRTAHVSPAQTVANVARNVALHLGVQSERINDVSSHLIAGFIRAIGQDPNDPGQLVALQTTGKPLPFKIWCVPRDELKAGDPLHFALYVLAGVLYFLNRRRIQSDVGWLGLGIAASLVLYSALLRWGPFNARYHLPLFVLGAAFSALVLVRSLSERAVNILVAFTLLVGFPLALMNNTRPLFTKQGLRGSILTMPRDQTYFLFFRDFSDSCIAAARYVRNGSCRSIGLDAQLQHEDYLMQALLNENRDRPKLQYMGVSNSTTRYATVGNPGVCTVVCLGCAHSAEKLEQYGGPGINVQTFDDVAVFEDREGGTNSAGRWTSIQARTGTK